jgi:hypothetical protein
MLTKININNRQYLYLQILFFVFSILTLINHLPILGVLVLILLFWHHNQMMRHILVSWKCKNTKILSLFIQSSYYIVSLTIFYYIFGLSTLAIITWLFITNSLMFTFSIRRNIIVSMKIPTFNLNYLLKKPLNILVLLSTIFISSNFFAHPIISGSPTPWINVNWLIFLIFFILTLGYISSLIKKQTHLISTVFFFFIIISVVSIKYVLSYGFDTLLHQSALKYISLNGQIDPLTPFYIGQYSLELLIHKFAGLSFLFLERCLVPVFLIFSMVLMGKYFSIRLKIKQYVYLIPIGILVIIPKHLFYTSPYAFALIWAIISIAFLYLYLNQNNKQDLYFSVITCFSSIFIHPFVGLNLLVGVLGVALFQKFKTKTSKVIFSSLMFILASTIVVLAFGLYAWLRDQTLILHDPIYFFRNFSAIFNDPIWYVHSTKNIFYILIYFYEKIHFFVILGISLLVLILDRKRFKANLAIFLISLSALISAWLFMSSLKISEFTYGDQVNYSFRLLQTSKWFLFPLIMTALVYLFNFLKRGRRFFQIIVALFLSIILLTSWYITYPRNDEISRININNIREIDYQALDLIYNNENGKNGYLVFANQLFGAGAIQKYGFEPYYESQWGNIFYYSVPMGSELNKKYEQIMNLKEFDEEIIYEVLEDINLNKAYLIITDYWPLSDESRFKIEKESTQQWDINNQIQVYLFEK